MPQRVVNPLATIEIQVENRRVVSPLFRLGHGFLKLLQEEGMARQPGERVVVG